MEDLESEILIFSWLNSRSRFVIKSKLLKMSNLLAHLTNLFVVGAFYPPSTCLTVVCLSWNDSFHIFKNKIQWKLWKLSLRTPVSKNTCCPSLTIWRRIWNEKRSKELIAINFDEPPFSSSLFDRLFLSLEYKKLINRRMLYDIQVSFVQEYSELYWVGN